MPIIHLRLQKSAVSVSKKTISPSQQSWTLSLTLLSSLSPDDECIVGDIRGTWPWFNMEAVVKYWAGTRQEEPERVGVWTEVSCWAEAWIISWVLTGKGSAAMAGREPRKFWTWWGSSVNSSRWCWCPCPWGWVGQVRLAELESGWAVRGGSPGLTGTGLLPGAAFVWMFGGPGELAHGAERQGSQRFEKQWGWDIQCVGQRSRKKNHSFWNKNTHSMVSSVSNLQLQWGLKGTLINNLITISSTLALKMVEWFGLNVHYWDLYY